MWYVSMCVTSSDYHDRVGCIYMLGRACVCMMCDILLTSIR